MEFRRRCCGFNLGGFVASETSIWGRILRRGLDSRQRRRRRRADERGAPTNPSPVEIPGGCSLRHPGPAARAARSWTSSLATASNDSGSSRHRQGVLTFKKACYI